jgi:hypothetical protein
MAMLMMYGYAPESLDDPIIHLADEAATLAATLLQPGGTLINVLPILRHVPSWVPGATGKKIAEKVRRLTVDTKRIPMEHVIASMVSLQCILNTLVGAITFFFPESWDCDIFACD